MFILKKTMIIFKMDADSFDIVLNGKTSASFKATTTIGSTNAAHTFIDS